MIENKGIFSIFFKTNHSNVSYFHIIQYFSMDFNFLEVKVYFFPIFVPSLAILNVYVISDFYGGLRDRALKAFHTYSQHLGSVN